MQQKKTDNNASSISENKVPTWNRRQLLGAGTALVAATGIGVVDVAEARHPSVPSAPPSLPPGLNARRTRALQKRIARATVNLTGPNRNATANGDETSIANYAANYSKGLPHDGYGEPSRSAYEALRRACLSDQPSLWNDVPLGGTAKQVSPQAAGAFQMEGADSSQLLIPLPPSFPSEDRAAEMVELYWMALLRDVPFSQYPNHALALEAVNDLRRFNRFRNATPNTLFRGTTTGELIGPYLSQFLYRNVPFGAMTITQKYAAGTSNVDFMTTLDECLNIQNGRAPAQSIVLDAPHYSRNGRDLGEYVHKDFSYQAFLNAALILLGLGGAALDDANPYKTSVNQAAFVTLGGVDVLTMVAQVAQLGLKAAWYQKWSVHRTLRPEAFALRVHQTRTNVRNYPIHASLFASPVLEKIRSKHGTYLLPMAFAEGSPTHPSFPAGHAAIAGACVTVLKAFFNEAFVMPNPVVASDDGSVVEPFNGALTLGGELDKLAANIAIGRNIAGVHYWSDGIYGMQLGEQVALSYLADLKTTYQESFAGFSLTKFDGGQVTV